MKAESRRTWTLYCTRETAWETFIQEQRELKTPNLRHLPLNALKKVFLSGYQAGKETQAGA